MSIFCSANLKVLLSRAEAIFHIVSCPEAAESCWENKNIFYCSETKVLAMEEIIVDLQVASMFNLWLSQLSWGLMTIRKHKSDSLHCDRTETGKGRSLPNWKSWLIHLSVDKEFEWKPGSLDWWISWAKIPIFLYYLIETFFPSWQWVYQKDWY